MILNKKINILSAIIFATGICNIAEAASNYTITALSTPQYRSSVAAGINASGQLVGWGENIGNWPPIESFYFDKASSGVLGGFYAADNNDFGDTVGFGPNTPGHYDTHAFIYRQGNVTNIGSLVDGDSGSYALGINNSGQVVGRSRASGGDKAFLYEAGDVTWLSNPFGGPSTTARDISNSGYITGDATSANFNTYTSQAYLYKNGVMQGLGTGGGTDSYGRAVNDIGYVVGEVATGTNQSHAFLYKNGQMLDIRLANTNFSNALGVNLAGQVVGSSMAVLADGSYDYRAFLYSNGTTVDLNSLVDPLSGWRIDSAYDINDKGQIAAIGCKATGCTALILTPVPEPATALYLVFGLGLAGVVARRRNS